MTPATLLAGATGLTDAAILTEPTPAPTPPPASCETNPLCEFIYRQTGVEWLAESGYYLLVKPFRIILIIVIAFVVRLIAHRMIRRLTRGAAEGRKTGLLRPLRERVPMTLQEAAGLRSQRRRQRAESLASVLRSIASVSVFIVAGMLILDELGVNLAPLIASAGIVGVALGFGAQHLIKDFISGLFMLLEDQYGIGDVVDLGEARGAVEAVGLRITTLRDIRGVVWYIRNGEIIRVGNRSQGWAQVVVDVPIGFANVDDATAVLQGAMDSLAEDTELATDLLERPRVLGVEQITLEGAEVRLIAKTVPPAQWHVARVLRQRLTDALVAAGIVDQMTANRVFIRQSQPPGAKPSGANAAADATDPGAGDAA